MGGGFTTFGVPFNKIGTTDGLKLTDLQIENLTKASRTLGVNADQIWVWSGTVWQKYFFSTTDSKWIQVTGTRSPFVEDYKNGLPAGGALYFKSFKNAAVQKVVTGSGEVESDSSVEYPLNMGGAFTYVGNPYPTRLDINNTDQFEITNLTKASRTLGVNADQIWVWSGTVWVKYFFSTGATDQQFIQVTGSRSPFAEDYKDGLKPGEGLYIKTFKNAANQKSVIFKKNF